MSLVRRQAAVQEPKRYNLFVSFAPSNAGATESTASSGRALAGFLLSGFLLALLGAILPAWGYHRDPPDFIAVGNYFLSVAVGLAAAIPVAWRILERRGLRFLLVFACLLACAALLYLALVPPPLSSWWRVAGLLVLGLSAGLLNVALFQALSRGYTSDAAGTVIQGGIWYGLGCLAATLLVEGAFYAPVSVILVLMAAAPAIFAVSTRALRTARRR